MKISSERKKWIMPPKMYSTQSKHSLEDYFICGIIWHLVTNSGNFPAEKFIFLPDINNRHTNAGIFLSTDVTTLFVILNTNVDSNTYSTYNECDLDILFMIDITSSSSAWCQSWGVTVNYNIHLLMLLQIPLNGC